MSFYKIRIQLILLNVLLLLVPSGVLADDFKLIPSLAVREEYNDNIFGSVSDTVDDFITTISPGLELVERTERLDLGLSAIVSPFFYCG